MRILKLLVLSFVVLFVVLSLLSLLFPSQLRLSRAVNIAAPKDSIEVAVGDLRRWSEWSEFIRNTPLTGTKYSDPSIGRGAFLHSDQLDLAVLSGDRDSVAVDWKLSGGRRFEGGYNIYHNGGDSITVQSWFDFRFRWYPWEKLGILVYDKQFGPAMEESLKGLKRYLEKTP